MIQLPVKFLLLDGPESSKGYTISEVLIVLIFWSILLISIVPLHHRTFQHIQSSHFISQLKDDVLLTQHLTMQDHIYYMLLFRPNTNEYILYDQKNKTTIFKRSFPDSWSMQLLTLESTLRFNENGVVTKPGTMKIHTPYSIFKIVFPFGASRLTIEEL
ncbi:competence type IV pilus minor pilin ComGD [Halobacillus halophilus]|uniref:competence type IV pilus minor pilin ComGD n=1 Tax=Halobacillus halophilus TaxID=1570 RepID=UPI001CD7427E|nr:competence type IV pilus minor pilin ComGD [Halobacillus halophilus]MCA1009668.1 competence protein ComG [Halobacillus halophilus]